MKGLILTYLLTYGGAALALFNPFVGVCVYWILDLVRPQVMFGWAGASGPFSEIIAIATLVGWAAKGFGNRQFLRAKPLITLLILFTLWSMVSAALAPNSVVALAFVKALLKRTAMFVVAATLVDSLARVRQLAWVFTGSVGYLALELNIRYFVEGVNQVQGYGYGSLDNNSLAITMVTSLGVAAFLGLAAPKLWQKGIALASAVLIAHTVLLSFSRGGLLGLIIAGLAATAVMPKRPRYIFALVCAIVLVLSITGPELRARFESSFTEQRDVSAQSRLDLWWDCIQVIKRYPVFGAGPDHFPLIVEEFGWPPGKEAHSLWLQLGAELGVPAAALLLLFYLMAIRRVWPLARIRAGDETAHWLKHVACMVVTSLAGFIVSVQFVTMEGVELPLYVVILGIGALRLAPQVVDATVPAGAMNSSPAFAGPPWHPESSVRGSQ